MALLSILVLVAIKMHETKKLVVQETTSWYDKKGEPTLGDIIMVIRRSIWVKMYFSTSKNFRKKYQLIDLSIVISCIMMARNHSRRRVEFQCLMIKIDFAPPQGERLLAYWD
jgi:hypothetical protein